MTLSAPGAPGHRTIRRSYGLVKCGASAIICDMVKALSFFKRKSGMSCEAYQGYWRTAHPDVVVKLPGIRRYVQSHTLPSGYRKGEPIYDGIAEVWFDDTRAMRALVGTAAYAAVQADEAKFIERSTNVLLVPDAHDIMVVTEPENGVSTVE